MSDLSPLPTWKRPDNFRVKPHQNLVDRLNQIAPLSAGEGHDVVNLPNGRGVLDRRPRVRSTAHFTARTANAVRVSGTPQPWRWTYAFYEVEKTLPGYGGWTDKVGGRTGVAYNLIEDQNADTGILGNGVDVSNLDTAEATFAPQPIPLNTRIEVYAVTLADGTVEYWTMYESGVDGLCDSEGGGPGSIDGGSGTWT